MDPSTDKHRGLPTTIDVGGEIFDLRADTNVSSSHKGYDTFKQTFSIARYGKIDVEYLLRRYLFVGQNLDQIFFDMPEHRLDLIRVIKKRIQQLHESNEMTSNIVKNISIQRFEKNLREIVLPTLERGTQVKKISLPRLSENEIFQTILEISWYLAHPNEVPHTMEKEWNIILDQLKEQRIPDFIKTIRQLEEEKGLPHEENPLQYFKKLNMDDVVQSSTLQGALDRVKHMATVVNAEPVKPHMEQRLRNLVNVLQLKQYVDESDPVNESGIRIVDTKRLSSNLIENPRGPIGSYKGGRHKSNSILSVPLGQAMLPVFRYLQELYDPIYEILEKGIVPSIYRAVLPHLLLLLHLCNEFYRPSTPIKREFGFYHLKNISEDATLFLSEQLQKFENSAMEMKTDEEREIFRKQVFQLPQLRLRSLIRNDGGMPTMENHQSIVHLQFFVTGVNLHLPTLEEFKTKNPDVDSEVYHTLRKIITPSSVFLCYTDASTTQNDLPFRFFEIDYHELQIGEPSIPIQPYSAELESLGKKGLLKDTDAFVDKLLTLTPHMIFNHPELAMSVLLGLKHRMPK